MRSSIPSAVILTLLLPATALGWPPNRDFIPHGNVFSCATCHENAEGGGPRNHFGEDFEATGLQGWGPELAALDSDDDGFTNGEELLDPDGVWRWFGGAESPGDPTEATNPADPLSFPVVGNEEPVEPEEEPVEPEEEPVEPEEEPVEPEEEPVEPEEEPLDGPADPGPGADGPEDVAASCAQVDVGSRCATDEECGPEGRCLDHLAGGYCTADAANVCCPDGSTAVSLQGGADVCLKSCAADVDCHRGDDTSLYCDDDNTCWGCEIPSADVGASCALDGDCGEGGVCVTDAFGWTFGGGYCAVDATSWCCPEGGVEVVLGEGPEAARWCVSACAESGDCRGSEGYSCLPDVGACWPDTWAVDGPSPSDADADEVDATPPAPQGTPLPTPTDNDTAVGGEAATPDVGTAVEGYREEESGCRTAPLGAVLLRLNGRR